MTDLTETSDDELLNMLKHLRRNIETNLECDMHKSAQINMQDEREVVQELDNRGIDYDDDWTPTN